MRRKFFFAVWPCMEMDVLGLAWKWMNIMARGVAVKSIDDKNMDISTLEKFLQERIKVGGKPGALSDTVHYVRQKERSPLTSPPIPTSPNVSDQKYLRKYNLCDCIEQRQGLKLRQAVEELLYIFGSAFVMENENSGCLVGCDESLIASISALTSLWTTIHLYPVDLLSLLARDQEEGLDAF
ncbi:hypothetical protein HID58_059622 [Brassica napus]|uniref:Large ribosomal subunit protein eL22 n=1 Tax=Brassica napus TaxID=3708 RepID=A0ABQ7ZTF2_BRANA|nr:hypothetical protein HID58_059622 [Brassica napus]